MRSLSKSLLLKAIWITSLPFNALLTTRVPQREMMSLKMQDERRRSGATTCR